MCKLTNYNNFMMLFCIPITFPPAVDDLQELLSILEEVIEWHQLGLYLGVKESALETVDAEFRNLMDAKREMLKLWLKQDHQILNDAGLGATWRSLIKALRSMEYNVLAKRIEDEVQFKMSLSITCIIALTEFFHSYKTTVFRQHMKTQNYLWKVHYCKQLDLYQSQLRIYGHSHHTLQSKYVKALFRTNLMNVAGLKFF